MSRRLDASLVHTIRAAFWMFGGRGIGLVWTLFLIHDFGIADYGRYAMAFAVATLVAPIDYYFFVGSVRSTDEEFRRDRVTRFVAGVVLVVVGLAVYPTSFVIGFGVAYAGADTAFNAMQSTWMRAGRPDRLTTNVTLRQAACVTVAVAYALVVDDATLAGTCLAYLLPNMATVVGVGALVRQDRPAWPRGRARAGLLLMDAFTLAGYWQTDVLFLGLLVDERTAGYYGAAQVTAFAASAIGGAYAQTFHEPLRASGGDPATGPPTGQSLVLGSALGAVVAVVGGVLAVLGVPAQVWASFLIVSPLTALMFYRYCLVVVLTMQRRDVARVVTVASCIVVKAAVLVSLTIGLDWGAIGAATAALVAEIVLVAAFAHQVHGRRTA